MASVEENWHTSGDFDIATHGPGDILIGPGDINSKDRVIYS